MPIPCRECRSTGRVLWIILAISTLDHKRILLQIDPYLTLNKSPIQVFTRTTIPPLPTPWIARPDINKPAVLLSAQTKLPTRKIILADINIILRPHMSLSLPQSELDAALARTNDDPIQVKPSSDARNCSEIVGNAVVMIVCQTVSEFLITPVNWLTTSRAARKRTSFRNR